MISNNESKHFCNASEEIITINKSKEEGRGNIENTKESKAKMEYENARKEEKKTIVEAKKEREMEMSKKDKENEMKGERKEKGQEKYEMKKIEGKDSRDNEESSDCSTSPAICRTKFSYTASIFRPSTFKGSSCSGSHSV